MEPSRRQVRFPECSPIAVIENPFNRLASSTKFHYAVDVICGVSPPRPRSVVPVAVQFFFRRKMDDAHKHFGELCRGSRAEFVPGCLQGYKNFTTERTTESPGGGTSERERPI